MSASDEEISNVIGGTDRRGGQGGSDGDDDDDDDDDDAAAGDHGIGKNHRRKGCGFGKDIAKAKQVVLHQFTRASKKLHRSRNKRDLIRSSSSRNARSFSGKMIRDDGTRTGCKFCFSRPQVLESPNGSPTSDPNDPNFSYVMLKNLIEKNDFRSKECNPHLD